MADNNEKHKYIKQFKVLNTVELQIIAAATINFEYFQGPFLLSKLKEVTKGAANNKVRPLIP